ncbi:hypothetical protein DYB34_008668 [Aphanomyces astaci]|uniref:BTB domain-containing protein n=1 Tax=Aphanomyces astaci TaxID=112090 RepID=A0A397BQV4_APHAT|nr:hypothetical protein DYB36_004690 [Aphanomyces astaci]RHY36376.1 hypothetical protein DYB34_008668 [Aphanomyces astaci]
MQGTSTNVSTTLDQVEASELETKLAAWNKLERRVEENLALVPDIVTLNVGGTTFQTGKGTLLRVDGSYFHALLGSGLWAPTQEGAYFLDLDPVVFRHVLLFLHTGDVSMVGLTFVERTVFKSMMKSLNLDGLKGWQWHPTDDFTLSTDSRTIARSATSTRNVFDVGAVAELPPCGSCRIRVDNVDGPFRIGLGTITEKDDRSRPRRNQCYLYESDGRFFNKNHHVQSSALPNLKTGDVVTIRRAPLRIGFAVNDDLPFHVELVDPSEELVLVVGMYRIGTKLTSVD